MDRRGFISSVLAAIGVETVGTTLLRALPSGNSDLPDLQTVKDNLQKAIYSSAFEVRFGERWIWPQQAPGSRWL